MSRPTRDHDTIGVPIGTKLLRITRLANGWRLWLAASPDYRYGTFLELSNQGRVIRMCTREDEGDELIHVRPTDDEIRRKEYA